LRHQQDIAPYVAGERKRSGEARSTNVREFLAFQFVNDTPKDYTGSSAGLNQLCKGAPWVVKIADLQREDMR